MKVAFAVLLQAELVHSFLPSSTTSKSSLDSSLSTSSKSDAAHATARTTFVHQRLRQANSTSSNITSICGYSTGNISMPVSCTNTAFPNCNILGGIGVFGCCEQPQVDDEDDPGACNYHSACVESAYIKACDEACQADPHVIKCTNSDAQYCQTVSMNYAGVTSMTCTDSFGYRISLSRSPNSNAGAEPWRTTTYTGFPIPFSTATSQAATGSKPFYSSDAKEVLPHAQEIAAATFGAILVLLLVGGAVSYLWLRRPKTASHDNIEYKRLSTYNDT